MGFGRPRNIAPRSLVVAAAIVALGLPITAAAQQVAVVPAVKSSAAPLSNTLRGDQARTQFIIGLEHSVDFRVFSLTNPNRVFVDLDDVKLQLPPHPGETAVGLVKSFRGGVSAPGKARVVIDVTGPVIVDRAAIEKSKDSKTARLVLEIVAVDAPEAKPGAKRGKMPAGASNLGAFDVQRRFFHELDDPAGVAVAGSRPVSSHGQPF